MNQREMTEVIATRELYRLGPDGTREAIEVAIGKPQLRADNSTFYSPYRISGHGIEVNFFASGVDSIDALQSAMTMIGIELDHLNRKFEGALRWDAGVEWDLGFPPPKT